MRDGEIYSITNIITKKLYIGQALILINGRSSGTHKRFNDHISYALKYRDDCPKLCRAIRKYGKEAFVYEVLIRCNEDMLDYYEIKFIEFYDTCNSGYNILPGGQRDKGICPKEVSKLLSDNIHKAFDSKPEIKEKMSKQLQERWLDPEYKELVLSKINSKENIKARNDGRRNKILPEGIYEIYHSGILVGYRASLIIQGKCHTKTFLASAYPLETKLQMAIESLKEIKEKFKNKAKKSISFDLPRNISYARRNGEIVGYIVNITVNGKNLTKKFSSIKISMEDKYNMALSKLEEFKKLLKH